MPAPVPFDRSWKTFVALIGPGLVMIGGTIGTGEWVQGAGVAALYRGALLWVAPLAILAQVILNTEAMRYTLVTGEPMFTGFMRCRPGAMFWLGLYVLLDMLSWWPALSGLAAQILIFTITGQNPDPELVKIATCGILILCGVLLCFGGKIYNTLEVVLSGKVIFVLVYLLFCTVAFVPASVWGEVVSGMVNPFRVPADQPIQWVYVGAVAGFAGIGGMSNLLASNYVREKGWGMGAKVGAIGSAFGGQEITLSHLGTVAEPTPEAEERFNKWWKYVKRDQFGLWAWGSVIGMMLPCVMGAAFLKNNYLATNTGGWRAAVALAQDFGAEKGPVFLVLTLICGFVILFPGQFSAMDGIARRWCDALWSGSAMLRHADGSKVRYLYYSFVFTYVSAGCFLALKGISAPKMMAISGNMANLAIMTCILHTLYVTYRFLPKRFQPSTGKRIALVLAASFYAGIFFMGIKELVPKILDGSLMR